MWHRAYDLFSNIMNFGSIIARKYVSIKESFRRKFFAIVFPEITNPRVRDMLWGVFPFVYNLVKSTFVWSYYLLIYFFKFSVLRKAGLGIIIFFVVTNPGVKEALTPYFTQIMLYFNLPTSSLNSRWWKFIQIPDYWIYFILTEHFTLLNDFVNTWDFSLNNWVNLWSKIIHVFDTTSMSRLIIRNEWHAPGVIYSWLYGYLEDVLNFGDFWYGISLTHEIEYWNLSPYAVIEKFRILDYCTNADGDFVFFDRFYANYMSIEWLFGAFTLSGLFFALTVLASFLWINNLGLYGSFALTTFSLSIFWVLGLVTTFYVWFNNYSFNTSYGKWFWLTHSLEVGFDFSFDPLSMSFALLVLTIAFFINIYTFAYFRYEPNVSRLILFIDIFVVSMVLLVTAGNVIILYLGWEMIGITSFFLINFWATRMGTVKASFKAFTFNKISDCCMLIGAMLIYYMTQDINILHFNETVSTHMQSDLNTLQAKLPALHSLTYCFMIAAFIKSAQFGFHIWLPDSMEAPVPASALIHSATLVSAGIFLILRFYPLFELSPFARTYIIFFGSLTALFGGICSVFQTDVKRLLAYSTISHCGVLMFLTFFKNPDLVIIYLYVHGFFKAIIFMCMGHVIRFANNYQDMRRMGGFYKYLPFEALISFVALLNLGGVSFTWGYYMKHFMFIDGSPESQFNLFCFAMVVLGSLCGIIYSYKLYYYVFFDFKKARKHVYQRVPNALTKNYYHTNASLASNVAIFCLTVMAYILCGYLIIKYLSDHNIHFDLSYYANIKNNLKNFHNEYSLNLYFYINWFIVFLMSFVLFNNWKNPTDQSFKIKFFAFCCTFVFFFYIFYSILTI